MNIFKQLLVSLYSPKSIAMFRFQGIGKTILYVFILTLLSIVPTVIYFSMTLTNGVQAAQETIEEEIPSFTIENGQLHSEHTEPITIKKDDVTIYFDPSGEIDIDDLNPSTISFALLKNDFAVTSVGNIEHYSYSMMNDIDITKDDISELATKFNSLLAVIIPIFIVVIYIFSSGVKFIEVSILALFGLMLASVTGKSIQYRHLWRMSAYSVTLPTIFFMIMAFLQTNVPNGFLLNWLVSIIILYLAIKEIPLPKKKEMSSN